VATALYVYGVVPAGTTLTTPPTGVGSTDVQLLEADDVAAITGVVPLDEFGAEPLRGNLNDREWLERTAAAHDAVLEGALETTTVIPFRMATLYADEHRLRDVLQDRRRQFVDLLERFSGRVELGVKAYFEGRGPGSAEAASGRAYLLQRQADQAQRREDDAFALECARESHARLAAAAVEASVNRPQPSELSGRSERMLLNGAYLIPRDDERLEQEVGRLEARFGQRGVSYEVTGPWPPYNFVPRDLASG